VVKRIVMIVASALALAAVIAALAAAIISLHLAFNLTPLRLRTT
jgi:hypothetical protein